LEILFASIYDKNLSMILIRSQIFILLFTNFSRV